MAGIKGVSKKIIEINEFEHELIEKVYVVLKPGVPGVKISKKKSEAESYVSNLLCYKKNIFPFSKKALYITLCAMLFCIIAATLFFVAY